MKYLFLSVVALASAFALRAQQPTTAFTNKANYRTEFNGFSTRELSKARDLKNEKYYRSITKMESKPIQGGTLYTFEADMPILWLDRDVFVHIEGSRNTHALYVNDSFAGSASDSRLPSEFNVSKLITDGKNTFSIAVVSGQREPEETIANQAKEIENVSIYAQPRLRIDDMIVDFAPDSTNKFGVLKLDVVVSSTHNYTETFGVGYDIYNPDGKLKYYDLRDVSIEGNSRDTVHFEAFIYDALQYKWSAESPKLYDLTLYTKRQSLNTEYIPFRIGFGTTTWHDNTIYRNDRPVSIKAARYNSAATQTLTSKQISDLRRKGINTLYVDYPQPVWFYDVCDRTGMYVVDRANINTDSKGGDQTVNGTLSNNPLWKDEYVERVKGMYLRARMHPCIIAFSTGGDSGNGYAMYKAYQWLKEQGDSRPTVYRTNHWNSDMELPQPQ